MALLYLKVDQITTQRNVTTHNHTTLSNRNIAKNIKTHHTCNVVGTCDVKLFLNYFSVLFHL